MNKSGRGLILFVMLMMAFALGCAGEQGPPGGQGPQGPAGPPGPVGPAGELVDTADSSAPSATPAPDVAATMADDSPVEFAFYGNQHFRFVSPGGKVILINPWIKGNKDAGIDIDFYKDGEVDLILVTGGHSDDQGNSVEIAANTGATVFVIAELGELMQDEIKTFGGDPQQIYRGALGGRFQLGDITVQMLQSHHGTGVRPPEGQVGRLYGGPAAGFLIIFENGLRVLMAGGTSLTMDLQLWDALSAARGYVARPGTFHDASGRRCLRCQIIDDGQSKFENSDSTTYSIRRAGAVDGYPRAIRRGGHQAGVGIGGIEAGDWPDVFVEKVSHLLEDLCSWARCHRQGKRLGYHPLLRLRRPRRYNTDCYGSGRSAIGN